MNEKIFELLGANSVWENITDVLLALVFVVLGVFAIMGLKQWISRKNLFKVDKELLLMIPILAVMSVIYFVFDKIWVVSTRPVVIDGILKSSFPSSHVMVATTILVIVMIILPKYLKNRRMRILFDVLACVLILVMMFGRVASGMHWTTDVIAGLVFGAALALIYKFILNKINNSSVI